MKQKTELCVFCLASVTHQKLPSQPGVVHCLQALSLLLVFWIACGGIGRLRGKRAPGWIISCSSMPDGHIAVTWRGNGKWHHYHSNTGTTFGVRAWFQRICHTTSHLPTGKKRMPSSQAVHSVDNYFIRNDILLVGFVLISSGVVVQVIALDKNDWKNDFLLGCLFYFSGFLIHLNS